jgi:hypothetical protein
VQAVLRHWRGPRRSGLCPLRGLRYGAGMNRFRRVKAALIAIGFLAIPAIGISVIPEQHSAGLNTGVSQSDSPRTEGDSNPQPVATVTRYAEAPAKADTTGTCKVSIVVGPSPAVTPTSTATPYAPVYGLAHTHSVQVKIPCPVKTVTETPTSTK